MLWGENPVFFQRLCPTHQIVLLPFNQFPPWDVPANRRSKRDVCGFSNLWFCVLHSCLWPPWLPGAKVKDCDEWLWQYGTGLPWVTILWVDRIDVGFSGFLHAWGTVNMHKYLFGSGHAIHNWIYFSVSYAFLSCRNMCIQRVAKDFLPLHMPGNRYTCVHMQTHEYWLCLQRSLV